LGDGIYCDKPRVGQSDDGKWYDAGMKNVVVHGGGGGGRGIGSVSPAQQKYGCGRLKNDSKNFLIP